MMRDNWWSVPLDLLTPDEITYLLTNLSSKLWRLDNLYYIKDKYSNISVMKLNNSQLKVLTKYKHNKKIILKSRQQGISTLYLAYNLDSCIFDDGTDAGLQSYGLKEAEKLADRASLMWERFPLAIKQLFGLTLTTDNKMALGFSNLSSLKIGNFRGDTLQSLHVSELGKIAKDFPKKAKELKTGAFQAVAKNNIITIESTAEGKSGLFYDMWVKAEQKAILGQELTPLDFQAIFLPWFVDPDCQLFVEVPLSDAVAKYLAEIEDKCDILLTDNQKWWYQAEYDILGEDMTQEYPSTSEEAFNQSVDGMYYKDEFKNLVIRKDTFEEGLLVHRAIDLGMNDEFVILFFQIHEVDAPEASLAFNNKRFVPKIIAEYKNNGKSLEYYKHVCDKLAALRGFTYGITYAPHDAAQTELIAGVTRFTALKKLGFKPVQLPRAKILDGINIVRRLLPFTIFDEDLDFVVTAIQNYRKKRDDKLGVYLDSPVHDEHSHPADALRYMAVGLKNHYPSVNEVIKAIQRKKYQLALVITMFNYNSRFISF